MLFALALNAAGETTGPAAPALAAVATSGYGAFIAGPALIGLISDATSLPAALSLVGVLCLAAAALAPATRRDASRDAPGGDCYNEPRRDR